MTLANLDQALKDILDRANEELGGFGRNTMYAGLIKEKIALEAMRRAYRLAESKNELSKMIGEPAVPALKEGAGE